jgi:hypothetical protein
MVVFMLENNSRKRILSTVTFQTFMNFISIFIPTIVKSVFVNFIRIYCFN